MHELGIVQSWLSAAREAAAGRTVSTLRVRVGALSGAEPEALSFAFSAAAPAALGVENPRLEIETVPATRRCSSCSAVYPFPGTGPACPSCGSSSATWLSGFELDLVSATLADPPPSKISRTSSPSSLSPPPTPEPPHV